MEEIINERYRIVKLLGSGGMAHVFLAEDMNLTRQVAVKQIRTDEIPPSQLSHMNERFRREAQNLARLTDVPGVVTVLDYGIENAMPFLVMNYLPGGTLKDNLGTPIDPKEAAQLLIPVAEALSYVHSIGIVHRDIKPSNLLYDRFGRLSLADFGIAKAFESTDATLTGTGVGVGTAAYMAPEQWRGETTSQSDLYSLAIVYYEMITGRKPFEGETNSDVFLKAMTAPLPDPREFVPTLSPQIHEFLVKATKKAPEDRLPSMREFVVGLKSIITEGKAEINVSQEKPGIIPSPPLQSAQPKPAHREVDLEEATKLAVSQPVPSKPVEVSSVASANSKPNKKLWFLWASVAIALVVIVVLVISLVQRRTPETIVITATDKSTASVEADQSNPEPEETESVPLTADYAVTEENCRYEEVFCVGLVASVGVVNDRSFNQAAWEGILQAKNDLGAYVSYIETSNSVAYTSSITSFADKDYDVIVTISYSMGEVTWEVAAMYPDIMFIGVDQWQAEEKDNVIGLLFQEWKAGFQAGALAALITETGVIASVCGTDIIPAVVAYAEGYEDGASYVNDSIQVITTYHPGSWDTAFTDPEWGAEVSRASINQGADVIFGIGGQTGNGGLIEAANYEGIYCIGVDYDQWYSLPEAQSCLVSSALKEIDTGVFDLLQQIYNGNTWSGNYYSVTGLASFHDFEGILTSEEEQFLAGVYADLMADRISYGDYH